MKRDFLVLCVLMSVLLTGGYALADGAKSTPRPTVQPQEREIRLFSQEEMDFSITQETEFDLSQLEQDYGIEALTAELERGGETVCIYQTGFGEKDSECIFWKLPPAAPGAAPARRVRLLSPEPELSCSREGQTLKLTGIPQGMKIALRWQLSGGKTHLDALEFEGEAAQGTVQLPEDAIGLEVLPRLRSEMDDASLEKAAVLDSWKIERQAANPTPARTAQATEPPRPTQAPEEETPEEETPLTLALKDSAGQAELGQALEGTLQGLKGEEEIGRLRLLLDQKELPAEFTWIGQGVCAFTVNPEDFAREAEGKPSVSLQARREGQEGGSNELDITPITRVQVHVEEGILTYTGKAQSLQVTLEPLPQGDVRWFHRRKGETSWLEGRPEMTEAGQAKWEMKAEAPNCRFVYGDGNEEFAQVTMEITPRQMEITITARQKGETLYDGTEQTLEYELQMTPDCPDAAETTEWKRIASGQVTGKNAGYYSPEPLEEPLKRIKAVLEQESGGNVQYHFIDRTTGSLTVGKRPVEITAGNIWRIYGTEQQGETELLAPKDAALERDRFSGDMRTRPAEAWENAGIYETWVEVDDRLDSQNYGFTWKSGRCVVFPQSLNKDDLPPADFSQAMPDLQQPLQPYFAGMTVSLARKTVPEDGQPHPPEIIFQNAAGETLPLQEGRDFEIEIRQDPEAEGLALVDAQGEPAWDRPGAYGLILRGLGNYGGEIQLRYEITAQATSAPTEEPTPQATPAPTSAPTPEITPELTEAPTAAPVQPTAEVQPLEMAQTEIAASGETPNSDVLPGSPRSLWILAGAAGLGAAGLGAVCALLARRLRREKRRQLDENSRRDGKTIREA